MGQLQFTLLRGTQPQTSLLSALRTACFNPHAHEGRDKNVLLVAVLVLSVSIHAPARGATTMAWRIGSRGQVSIHAPARGATGVAVALTLLSALFQSTRPRGARRRRWPRAAATTGFNPRAREGRDRPVLPSPPRRGCFNPRAREGRNPPACAGETSCSTFQSTRPRGARRWPRRWTGRS